MRWAMPDSEELAIVLRDLAAILRFAANKKNLDVLSEAGFFGRLAFAKIVGCGRVEMWRGGFRFEHICSRLFRLAVPYWFDHGSVSTSRSSNRTCRSPASGSRTRPHAFVHGTSCPSLFKRTSPKCPYRCESG